MSEENKNHQTEAEEQHHELIQEPQPEIAPENLMEQEEVAQAEETSILSAEEWQKRYEELHNKYLYLLSDFQNYRRNVAKERIELQATAGRDILAALLPVLDDFDRAAKNNALDDGVTLIYHKLLHILQSKGLQPLEVQAGCELDADTQEAVVEVPAPSESLKGKIVEVVEKGYRLGERILRHAKVVVGK